MNLEQRSGALIDPPMEIGGKIKVFGCSSFVMQQHSLIYLGGSLGPPGLGPGRLTFYLTSLLEQVVPCCAKCIVTEQTDGNKQKVQCSSCLKFIHIHICDKSVRKRKGLADIPAVYVCFICKKAEKDRQKEEQKKKAAEIAASKKNLQNEKEAKTAPNKRRGRPRKHLSL